VTVEHRTTTRIHVELARKLGSAGEQAALSRRRRRERPGDSGAHNLEAGRFLAEPVSETRSRRAARRHRSSDLQHA
jgi:hypothetical protein